MRVAIDVMGGDHAPDQILNGALDGLEFLGPDDQLTLVGPEDIIREGMAERNISDDRIEIVHATQVIEMDESPIDALKNKTESTIVQLAKLAGKRSQMPADIIISAGNTGAMVAAAQVSMRRLPGVIRPGIAVTIPTFYGPIVVCDVGANIAPKPHHLYQYAHMAGIYYQEVICPDPEKAKLPPRIGLMSVGGEEGKGTDLTKSTAKLMREDASLNYAGYVEGREIFDNKADVIITEGFVGNVVLKLSEGLSSGIFKAIAHEIFETDPELAIRFEPVVKNIYKKHDYHEYGGAPLLGVRGVCVISHGSSIARTIKCAVRNFREYLEHDVNQKIVDVLGSSDRAEINA